MMYVLEAHGSDSNTTHSIKNERECIGRANIHILTQYPRNPRASQYYQPLAGDASTLTN